MLTYYIFYFDIIVVLCSVLISRFVAAWLPSHILINRILKDKSLNSISISLSVENI